MTLNADNNNDFRYYIRTWGLGHAILWTRRRNDVTLPIDLPEYNTHSMVQDYEPQQIFEVLWAKNCQPHLPFTPKDFSFEHPMLQRFDYTFHSLPIVRTGGLYHLDTDVMHSWQRMEIGLKYVGAALLVGFLFPLEVWQQYPCNHGYTRSFASQAGARNRAWDSRRCFLDLIAFVRFAMTMQSRDWVGRLARINHGRDFHPGWLEELSKAISSYEPFGAIVDPSQCAWSQYLNRFEGQCPLWYLAATISEDRVIRYVKTNSLPATLQRPSQNDIKSFIDEFESIEQWIRDQPPEEFDLCPKPYCYPCQRTPPLRPILRWQSLTTYDTPPNHIPTLDLDTDHVESTVEKEPLFLPDIDDDALPFQRESSINRAFVSSDLNAEVPYTLGPRPEPTVTACIDLGVDLSYVYKPKAVTNRIYTPTILAVLEDRLGFTNPDPQGTLYPLIADFPFKKAAMALSNVGNMSQAPAELEAPICTFVSSSLARDVNAVPSGLWDLSSTNRMALHPNNTMSGIAYQIGHFDLIRPGEGSRAITMYTLTPENPSPTPNSRLIATDNACTAVQCLRSACESSEAYIVRYLLEWGCRFFQPQPASMTAPYSLQPITGLGYRPEGYQPQTVDYTLYEQARDQFLTPSRARAALKRGGMIARLVREKYSDLDEALEVVLSTQDPPLPGHGLELCHRDGVRQFDDNLSEAEEDLICGVYKVYADASGNVFSDVSWWPKSSAWITSGFNVGYWSSDAEDWFQRRKEAIKAGNSKFYTATGWKDAVRMHRRALDLAKAHEFHCAQFLGD